MYARKWPLPLCVYFVVWNPPPPPIIDNMLASGVVTLVIDMEYKNPNSRSVGGGGGHSDERPKSSK